MFFTKRGSNRAVANIWKALGGIHKRNRANIHGGSKLSVGGELGGIGNDFLTWSVRGRASFPFRATSAYGT